MVGSNPSIHDFEKKLRNELERLEAADIDDADLDAIRRYKNHRRGSGETSTLVTNLSRVRNAAERAEMPLTEMDYDDFTALKDHLITEYDLTEGTMSNYRTDLRGFFEFLGREWYEKIDTRNHATYDYDPKRMWTPEEQRQLLDAAPNARDQALVAVLFDSRQRIGAIGTLRVGDVEFHDRYAIIHLNDEAEGLKGASGLVPLTWSATYVQAWLNSHPCSDDDSAALFCALPGHAKNEPGSFMRYNQLADRFKRVAELAGFEDVDPGKIKVHNTRHTGLSRALREGDGEGRINKLFAKWDADSTQWKFYDHVRDEEAAQAFLEDRGLVDEDGEGGRRFDECPHLNCGVELPPGRWEFCPGCGRALTQEGAATLDELTALASEESVTSESVDGRVSHELVEDWIEDNIDVVTTMVHDSLASTDE